MARCGYTVSTTVAVALSAATVKTVLGIRSGATFGLDLKRVVLSFDGTTGSAVPVLVEICHCTWANANVPGTASTSRTVIQKYGRVIASGMTAASAWTSEPTVLVTLDEFLLHPQAGIKEAIPLGDTPDCGLSEGFAIRITAPAAVNARASLDVERA